MLDAPIRKLIDPPLDALGRGLAKAGLSANAVTLAGMTFALLAAVAIAAGAAVIGFWLILANRAMDGLDGAIARARGATDFGGFLDTVCDYVFYAAIPLAFAIADPSRNAVAAAALLASFCLTASSYLAFAALAAKRGMETKARGKKAYYAALGLMEGTETIAFFLAFALFPQAFATLAWIFAALCVLTVLARTWQARDMFR